MSAASTAANSRVLLHAFSSFTLGGAQARFLQLVNAFGPRYRHLIVAMDDQWQAAERLSAAVPWDQLRVPVVRGGGLDNRSAFRRVLADTRPDLVVSYNWGAVEWAAANCPAIAPHVHVEDGFGPAETQTELPRRVWARRLLLNAARAQVVVPSRRLLQHARGWWIPPSRLRYIPNGVPRAEPPAAKPDGGSSPAITVGTVAGLRPEKNIGRLLKAVAAVSRQHEVRLLVVGDGPQRPELEAMAAQLGLSERATFVGYVTNPAAYLARMDVFALSSDTEQQPISMLEAMALSIPVVATAVGDVQNMLPGGAGVLSRPDDQAFALALADTLAKRDEWPAWGQRLALKVAEEFSFDRMLQNWGLVFDGRLRDVPAL